MIDLIDTQYSTDSMQAVPGNGSVTVIDMFATWCVGCEEQFRNLAAVHERVPGSVEFVSVSNEALGGSLSRADIREYWKHHAGEWSVGLDNNGALTRRLGVNGLPFTVVTNPDRHVVLAARGTTDPSVVEAAITKARHQ
jgi:thiol-disulfide isomerase/thioredoxin